MKIYAALINGVNPVKEVIDFSKEIEKNSDIISIEPCSITGEIEFKNEQVYTFLDVQVKMVLASSRSLKPIEHELNFKLDLVFGTGSDSDYPLEQEIDLKSIIYGHILLEKPLSIYLDDEAPEDKTNVTNPAFKDLKDWEL